jgi:3-methyladenine DNA glycosylase AlkD
MGSSADAGTTVRPDSSITVPVSSSFWSCGSRSPIVIVTVRRTATTAFAVFLAMARAVCFISFKSSAWTLEAVAPNTSIAASAEAWIPFIFVVSFFQEWDTNRKRRGTVIEVSGHPNPAFDSMARVTGKKLLATLRAALARSADPARAPKMQAYMKSAMPYHGCASPVAKRVYKETFAPLELSSPDEWRALVLDLWRSAKFREERYGAIALASVKRAKAWHDMASLPMFEEMIVTGAWWDYVDELAGHHVGPILRNEPARMRKVLLAWSKDGDMWKRRSSIIAQLGFKKETDLELLYACIEPSLDSKEFFLRKAIGWALRQYAWIDPAEVVRYVRAHDTRLSGLSKREALKNV